MSLRQPTSTLDRLSSLTIGDSERKTSTTQQREPTLDIPVESTGPGLVQRCVVVQKDQLGFGFTVCGERVKLVQNVRPGGAAVKAGVQEGDRIIKVNGSQVSSMSHQEVVKLIKSGTYVALTLQGPPPSAALQPLEPLSNDHAPNQRASHAGDAPPSPPPQTSTLGSIPSQRITGPKPLQDPEFQKHATQILRKMLEQEESELQALREEQSRNPSSSLEERIESAKRRAQQVRIKIQQDLEGTRSESVRDYVTAGEGRLSMDSNEGDMEAFDSPYSSPASTLRALRSHRQNTDTQTQTDLGGKALIISPEEDEEEGYGYAINEMDGQFQDIELLKSRPAHMAVFMRYVFTQLLDPNPLLFYLSVEAYLGSSPKEARALAPQICSHFLDPDAPLKIKVREEYLLEIETRLNAQEDIRGPLSELQLEVMTDIQDQILDYRNKQMMGLGSLFGEGDLQQLDGDPMKERQVVDRQITALWEILSKHEEDRSSPLAWAVLLYLRHSGIKLRDSKVFPGLSTEKEKWLAFLKTKKLSGTKKEKDGEDKKRNPILKYIAKPRNTSQSTFHVPLSPTEVRPGNVRNIIQQFENHTEIIGEDGDDAAEAQRLSSSSLGDDSVESPTISVRLARSESLKAQGEGRRRGATAGADSVPRSRSDVDMEDCGEEREGPGLRPLQYSTSSSASSSSARSLENPTPPYTPRSRRRSMDYPLALLPDPVALEEEVACEAQNWRDTVSPQLLAMLSPKEVDRQAVIYELFTTEVSHLRTLRVLDQVFYQKMRSVLNAAELACIFPNLPQVYELHASLCEAMKKRRENPVVHEIGDVMLARFEGQPGEEFQEEASQLCSQQSQARELIKNKRRKDPRFAHIIQECEASPQCRRLQLKDLLVSEMQRLTKYPLLLDSIIKHTEAGSPDLASLHRAQACCRAIVQAVDERVGQTEHQQRLHQYLRRLDASPQFKSLDLSTKRLIHEGSLTWKINKDKRIDIQALLLSDCLLLLQRGPDDRLQLRNPSRWMGGGGGVSGDSKTSLSPVVKLDSLLVRPVATNNNALYIISPTERQMYELVAGSPSEKDTWKDLLEKAIAMVAGSSPVINHSPTPVSSYSESPVSAHSNVYADSNITDPSDSIETHSIDTEHSVNSSSDRSERRAVGVAEAALRDVETLRQLLLQDLEEDCWSHDSDDTPTNETAGERSPLDGERQRPESLETVLKFSTDDWDTEPDDVQTADIEQPPLQVIRKALVAGPSAPSVPDDITDDVTLHSDQSSKPTGKDSVQGNTFYLVMPSEQGETATDDLNDPPTPTANHFPPLLEDPASEKMQSDEVVSACDTERSENNQQQQDEEEEEQQQQEEEDTSESKASHQSHVIKNVDEIFHTIERLTTRLRELKEIEKAHHQLLTRLREPLANQVSEEQQCPSVTVSRTPSLDRGSTDGRESSTMEPKILSTGF